ncbi:MAG: PAS domain S-box protein [Methanoregulaceae archaeon]|nr:PAS domain S-box protein [Methanoregulaceae archaeon]
MEKGNNEGTHIEAADTEGHPRMESAGGRQGGTTGAHTLSDSGEITSKDEVTEREQAEKEIKGLEKKIEEVKERLPALVRSIPDEVWFADAEGHLELVNPAVLNHFGMDFLCGDVKDIAAKVEVFRPDMTPRPVDEAPLLRALRGEVLDNIEEILRIPSSGMLRYRQVNATPVKDATGVIIGSVAVVRDITDRKKAEEALRESEEVYSFLFREAPFAISLTRMPDQTIVEVNEAFITMFGYQRGEIIGRKAKDLGILDTNALKEILTGLEKDGEIRDFECSLRTRSGETRWGSLNTIPITIRGTMHSLSMIQDISERKRIAAERQRRQAEIQALFDNIPAGLVLFDASPPYRVLVHNRFYQELFDEPFRTRGMAGLNVYDYAPAVEASGVTAIFDDAVRTQQPQHYLDFPYKSNPPKESWFNWYIAPIVLDGSVIALVSMSLDVTDRHIAQEALKKGMQKLDIIAESARLLLVGDLSGQIVRKICERVMAQLDCQFFFNYLIEDSSGRMRLNTFSGISGEAARNIEYLDPGTSICGYVAKEGIRIIAEDIQNSTDDHAALVRSFGAAAYVCNPLIYQETTIGTLSFGTRTRTAFTDEEIDLMTAVTDLVATAIARGRAEEALRQSEARLTQSHELLNSVTRQSGVMIAAEDVNLHYTYFNKAYADEIRKLTGKEPSLGMSMADIFAEMPDEQKKSVRQWRKVLAGTSLHETISFENPISGTRIFNVIHTPILDRDDEVIGAGEVSYEVTRQVRIEEELRKTSQFLENLINHANAPIIVWDPDFRITRFNRAFERLSGKTARNVIGLTPDILIPAEFRRRAMDLFRRTTTGESWEVVEIPILNANGEIRTVLWNSATLYDDDDGTTIIATIAQGQDITDRKQAEELLLLEKQRALEAYSLLNAAIESTTEGIYVVDTCRNVTSFNQNFAELWHIQDDLLKKGDDLEISTFLESQVRDPDGFSERISDIALHPDIESYDTLKLLDGRIIERHSRPQMLGNEIIGRVWSFQDVTEQRQAEQNLITSLQEKETLIREIHHRVKNNLQIVSGLLDMTRMRTSDSATNSILTDMMMKIKTMAQIHTRLYESKQFDKINMGSQIRDQIVDLSSIYRHSGTEIRTEIDIEDVCLTVNQAIPCALIVNEILSNAFKHAFRGKNQGTLEISARRRNDSIHIGIRDDGIGIPAEMDIYKTNSLGFKLIRSLVLQLNGSVLVRSDGGTEVIVEFPLQSSEK